jgi:hypothetical protein
VSLRRIKDVLVEVKRDYNLAENRLKEFYGDE